MTWTRTYSDEQLAAAVSTSSSWRGALRALGLTATSSGAIRSVRSHAERLGLDHRHFNGARRWTPSQLEAATAGASNWQEVGKLLGIAGTAAISSLRGHALRAGLNTAHLNAAPDDLGSRRALTQPTLARLSNAGPLLAAAWFTLCGHDVSWPLEPSRYDLLVCLADETRRVQVKTTTTQAGSSWKVYLSTCAHGRKAYDPGELDDFFVIDGDLNYYLIPFAAVGGLQAIHLNSYSRYRVVTEPADELGSGATSDTGPPLAQRVTS